MNYFFLVHTKKSTVLIKKINNLIQKDTKVVVSHAYKLCFFRLLIFNTGYQNVGTQNSQNIMKQSNK